MVGWPWAESQGLAGLWNGREEGGVRVGGLSLHHELTTVTTAGLAKTRSLGSLKMRISFLLGILSFSWREVLFGLLFS